MQFHRSWKGGTDLGSDLTKGRCLGIKDVESVRIRMQTVPHLLKSLSDDDFT